jgi:hypothetical protein
MWVEHGATVMLVDCTFKNNAIASTYRNSATLSINAEDPRISYAQQQDTVVIMKRCQFQSNSAAYDIVTNTGNDPYTEYSALVYSDTVFEVTAFTDTAQEAFVSPRPLSDVPAERQSISATSAWLQTVKQVSPSP